MWTSRRQFSYCFRTPSAPCVFRMTISTVFNLGKKQSINKTLTLGHAVHFLLFARSWRLTSRDKPRTTCRHDPSSARWGRALTAGQEQRQKAEGSLGCLVSLQTPYPGPFSGLQAPHGLSVQTRVSNVVDWDSRKFLTSPSCRADHRGNVSIYAAKNIIEGLARGIMNHKTW